MNEPTTTVSFRVAKSVKDQVDLLAQANRQSTGELARDQMMLLLHTSQTLAPIETKPTIETTVSQLKALEERLDNIEDAIREGFAAMKSAIAGAAKDQRKDLQLFAEVGHAVEEAMEERIESACERTLDAIGRLKQSQRSHKETVLQAIAEVEQNGNGPPNA
jgi:hypothetical protein